MGLKHFLEKIEPHFLPGGKHEKWYALYEAAATIFYTSGAVTRKRHTSATRSTPNA
ncbi:Na(+)-translocating NADH-quinone reductase subunit B [Neisseria mucosa]|nr:Na(+)-translocating NADH-quinone reductase subunit B [Neisseria mucosa]